MFLAVAGAALSPSHNAHATGALTTPGIDTVVQRVAIAVSTKQTTLWTSLSFQGPSGGGASGEVAIILPLPVGSALDLSSRAFFEALEGATAPRVTPPANAKGVCNGEAPGTDVAVEGDLIGMEPLSPLETRTFADASSLESWAAANGLVVANNTLAALASFDTSTRFVVMRYEAPGSLALTKTLRAVIPGSVAVLPLVLTAAKTIPLRVVTWELGAGRAQVQGNEVELDLDHLGFDVAHQTSNYSSLRESVLVDGQEVLVEAASHEALRDNLAVGNTSESVTSFVKTYFSRAKIYGDATDDDTVCAFKAGVDLGNAAVIADTCPRNSLGFVETGAACTETVDTGQVDPSDLRCGGVSDDLALMLSGQSGKAVWVTRSTLAIPEGKLGADLTVTFPGGARIDPIYSATSVDLSGCGGSSSSSSSASTTTSGSGIPVMMTTGSGSMIDVPLYRYSGCSCNGAYEQVGSVEADADSAPSGYYENESGCSTDTSSYTSDPQDCSGDPSTSGDTCDSGSDSSSGCDSGSSSGDSCNSGDGDSCDSGSGDSCASGSGDSCANDCAVAEGHRRKVHRIAPRLSGLLYGSVLLLAPLRRLRRPKTAVAKKRARAPRPAR